MEIIHKKTKIEKLAERVPSLRPALEQTNLFSENQCDDFKEWLENAKIGDKFCYHTGLYVSGRKVATLVYGAYEQGLVTMCQSRCGNSYKYWAIRIKPTKKK